MNGPNKVVCPHCGEATIARKKAEESNGLKVEYGFFCVFCGGRLEIAAETPENTGAADTTVLSRLLGGAENEHKIRIEAAADEKRFCRDCAEYVEHPFLPRCGKHHRAADPMGDCPSFAPKVRNTSSNGKKQPF